MPRPPRSNPRIKHNAMELRKSSTPAEAKLWSKIRNDQLGVTFRRHTCPAPLPDGKASWSGRCQGHAIGNYIPDFSQRDAVLCSPKAKLIIELDGSQHLEQEEYDDERTKYLEALGYRVIRFWNHDVLKDVDSVMRAIISAMEEDREL